MYHPIHTHPLPYTTNLTTPTTIHRGQRLHAHVPPHGPGAQRPLPHGRRSAPARAHVGGEGRHVHLHICVCVCVCVLCVHVMCVCTWNSAFVCCVRVFSSLPSIAFTRPHTQKTTHTHTQYNNTHAHPHKMKPGRGPRRRGEGGRAAQAERPPGRKTVPPKCSIARPCPQHIYIHIYTFAHTPVHTSISLHSSASASPPPRRRARPTLPFMGAGAGRALWPVSAPSRWRR